VPDQRSATDAPQDEGDSRRPATVPWRRVADLLRPIRWGLAAMVGLSVGGVLIGLVPPLALGVLVDALVERNDRPEAAVLAALMAIAILAEATAYVLSDGMYARNAGKLHRSVRLQMFDGARRRHGRKEEESTGTPSRFISDVLTLDLITVSILDNGSMLFVELVSAAIAISALEPVALVVIFPTLAAIWIVTRKTQEPAAAAGLRRQAELELMTRSVVRELRDSDENGAKNRFRVAIDRVMQAEVHYGWLQAFNRQGSAGLAKLGPIAVVVVAAFAGTAHVGTLISLYLLSQRAFWGFDGVVDLSLATQSVRGAVNRCFELIDTPSTCPNAGR
jgi:ABC-type bacteriocin/lantibiotic exporter with double-glycine peptidase domain